MATKSTVLGGASCLALIGAFALGSLPAAASTHKTTTTTHPKNVHKPKTNAKEADFVSWANQIRGELATCEAGTEDVETELGIILQAGASATAGDFVTLATAAKNGAPSCSITSNNGILNINTTNPPNGYSTLKSITSDLQDWAASDDQQVIIDAGKVADSNGNSTADVSSLVSDSQTADNDAATINMEMKTAASQAGIKGWKGLGLPAWGLQTKTGNTGNSGNT